jgi:hypothetical protein
MTTIQNPRMPSNPGELGAMIRENKRVAWRDGYREGERDGKSRAMQDADYAHQRGLQDGYQSGLAAGRREHSDAAERAGFWGMAGGFVVAMIVTWLYIGVTGGL